jgi:probable phosphoglycerate mutase
MDKSLPCKLIVVRHGQTLWNLEARAQGHQDSQLSELGQRQAEAVGEALSGASVEVVFSSDLGRAMQTAERISARLGVEISPDRDLRERNIGVLEGLTPAEMKQQFAEEYAGFVSGDPDYRIPNGESVRQRHDRGVRGATRIAARHPGTTVVIVTHGGILESLFRHAACVPLEARRGYSVFNASVNSFLVDNGIWTLESWGDISHLRSLGEIDDWKAR